MMSANWGLISAGAPNPILDPLEVLKMKCMYFPINFNKSFQDLQVKHMHFLMNSKHFQDLLNKPNIIKTLKQIHRLNYKSPF